MPLPPSLNHAYPTFIRGGRLIRVKSKELATFEKAVFTQSKQWTKELQRASETCKLAPALYLELKFYFKNSRLYTRLGGIKKLDVSNRIKAAEDAICKMLQFDDCKLFGLSATKVTREVEGMDAKIYQMP